MDRERKEIEFQKIAENVAGDEETGGDDVVDLESKSNEFLNILEVPTEERDRIQRTQVIDRAAAAIAFASILLRDEKMPVENESHGSGELNKDDDGDVAIFGDSQQGSDGIKKPGPNFWTWVPPSNANNGSTPTPTTQINITISYSTKPRNGTRTFHKPPHSPIRKKNFTSAIPVPKRVTQK